MSAQLDGQSAANGCFYLQGSIRAGSCGPRAAREVAMLLRPPARRFCSGCDIPRNQLFSSNILPAASV